MVVFVTLNTFKIHQEKIKSIINENIIYVLYPLNTLLTNCTVVKIVFFLSTLHIYDQESLTICKNKFNTTYNCLYNIVHKAINIVIPSLELEATNLLLQRVT